MRRSLSFRQVISLLPLCAALLLSACGFEPVYGARPVQGGGMENSLTQTIAVQVRGSEIAYRREMEEFKAQLEDALNPGGDLSRPAYLMEAGLRVQEFPLAISPDGTASRYNVVMNAIYTLTRLSHGQRVYTGKARRTSSYNNVSNAFYSTYVSSQDAIQRALVEMAQDVRLQVAGYFSNPALAVAEEPDEEPVEELGYMPHMGGQDRSASPSGLPMRP